jgi:hypothetical protein
LVTFPNVSGNTGFLGAFTLLPCLDDGVTPAAQEAKFILRLASSPSPSPKHTSVTRLGEKSPFGRIFCLWAHFFPEKYRPNDAIIFF